MHINKKNSDINASGRFSKFASKFYSKKKIDKMIKQGKLNGNHMEKIFLELMEDPYAGLDKPDKSGNQDIYYYGKHIGWINPTRNIGYIDRKAYEQLKAKNKKQAVKMPTKKDTQPQNAEVVPEKKVKYEIPSDELLRASSDIAPKKKITASVNMDEDGLRELLEDALDSDICEEIVSLAYGYDDYFADIYFTDISEFIDIYMSNDDPLDVVMAFYDGQDYDDNEDHANPNRDYARYDSRGTVETTNYPGDVYLDESSDEIIDYIMEHLDNDDFPDEIQEIVDQYNELNSEDDEDEDDYDDDYDEEDENEDEE